METLTGIDALAEWIHVSRDTLVDTMHRYEKASQKKQDEFGKSVFINGPGIDLENETFSAGRVTPVIHYCMGGLAMNARGQVLQQNQQPIAGLFAAGEVTGGLHGDNRLGGNSLLECAVFGRIIGQDTPIVSNSVISSVEDGGDRADVSGLPNANGMNSLRKVSVLELENHNTASDCWVAIDGRVFDLTEFARVHPGAEMIQKFAGKDATKIYDAVHAPEILSSPLALQYQVGIMAEEPSRIQAVTR